MKSLHEYEGYKAYLRDALLARSGGKHRGERGKLAQAMGCHTTFVSLVLNGTQHLSPEQGECAARYLGLSRDDARFFLLLLQRERASTAALRKLLDEELRERLERRLVLKDRLSFERELTTEEQATFYSSWIYGAIHVMVSLPQCPDDRSIGAYLAVSLERVREVLEFLLSTGLIREATGVDGSRYEIGAQRIHLPAHSPMIAQHHANWRLRGMQSLESRVPDDLHYTSVVTCSRADSLRIRSALVDAIEQVRGVVRGSADEEVYSYNLDFYGLNRSG